MSKTATINIRISPEVKNDAEAILARLGIPMATAIDMYLRQIALTGSIPFEISLHSAPDRLNADTMNKDQLRYEISQGIEAMENSRVAEASKVFEDFYNKTLK